MRIYVSSINIPGIDFIGINPLPVLRQPEPDHAVMNNGSAREEDLKEAGKNTNQRVLPYLMQDRYSRNKKPVNLKTVVMDNGILRAEFLADYGGKLRSLRDLRNGRELLLANPVLQPGNLAIRNAWLSGGIEWNIGQAGHTFHTCSPVFFARIKGKDGEEFLRIYEYERQKRLFWQVDFHLPEGSEFLEAHVRVVNDRNEPSPMYWWTNIAVKEVPKTRVFSSSNEAIYYDNRAREEWIRDRGIDPKKNLDAIRDMPIFIGRGRMPHLDGDKGRAFEFDASYPRNNPRAQDYFFWNSESTASPWEAAANPDGFIFFQRNTQPLRCNKMFCWGDCRGGRFWCDYLAAPGQGDYLELQAGIAPTQAHGYTMAAKSEIHFTQFFGSIIEKDPVRFYTPWEEARPYVETLIETLLPGEKVAAAEKHHRALASEAPVSMELLHLGSGWGALESLRRVKTGEKPIPVGFSFPESTLGKEQLPWLTLLETGSLPVLPPGGLPVSYMTDPAWKLLLEKAPNSAGGAQTGAVNYLAVMLWENLQIEDARGLWEKSAAEGDPLALRNLASAAVWKGDYGAAKDFIKRAFDIEQGKTDPAFAEEYIRLLLKNKDYTTAWKAYVSLPPVSAQAERIQILAAQAAIEIGEYDFVTSLFEKELAIIQEGEAVLSDLWFKLQARKQALERGVPYSEAILEEVTKTLIPPANIDFRMTEN
jgi:tetratricopeptide (TPR) repeat protein